MLQFKGLGIIVEIAGYGAISSTSAIWIGAAVVTAYVMVSGVHGSAWTAVAKDAMILAVVVFLGIYLPCTITAGSARCSRRSSGEARLHRAAGAGESAVVVLLDRAADRARLLHVAAHLRLDLHRAEAPRVIRKNAIVLPLYQLILLFVFFVGFAAILQVPGLTGADIDLALFRLSVKTFDPWFVGMIGAAGVLTALVPGSMILMTAATLARQQSLPRRQSRRPTIAQVARLAKLLVPVVALVAVFFTLRGGETIVALLLMGYSFVTQLFPRWCSASRAATWRRARAPRPASSPASPRSPPSA